MSESLADVVHEAVRKVALPEFLLARVTEDEAALAVQEYEDCDNPAHWGNARLLAECKAKRQIVEHYKIWAEAERKDTWAVSARLEIGVDLDQLVQVYADHPDFDPSWRL